MPRTVEFIPKDAPRPRLGATAPVTSRMQGTDDAEKAPQAQQGDGSGDGRSETEDRIDRCTDQRHPR